ncbi:Double-strand break repair protein AddB [Sulfitobacter noctilucicola]|uniref:Double-strand break repair protein AddB n=1 Tax=Sulfitobacter noctilucicola TaxID=1342301 RepID=A0A7W6M6Z1_9RHOB|nr:double-strand break repair protein AddB [Sulfitobacter noctilucicola]KIN62843.1 Double-strand break repair protein AddB [Sulfitobacter noctilucicola]MBB4172626.1 double-strand break repair protein AddB [Sulfitobacter noctilucicola]
MFEPTDGHRVFGLPPGVDFPAALVAGLRERTMGQPPESMAKIDLIVNTSRMERRLKDLFDAGSPGFLPRIRLLTDLDMLVPGLTLPKAIAPLRRRLQLAQLVSKLMDADSDLAPRASLYALSDSLATLIDEMQGEGVSPDAITDLDVSDQSGHWERAKRFLEITQQYLNQMDQVPDAQARQRNLVLAISEAWESSPPTNPVILAGSTGSRGTTALLMEAVAKLPQGAVILPGFDAEVPWTDLQAFKDRQPPEDHPQYRFYALMQQLGVPASRIERWTDIDPPSVARNRLVSLSLCPAPVTDSWLTQGPKLDDIEGGTENITLLEAPTPRIEALTIAMRMRKAVEDGKTVALITPDRMLTRQVTSALDRWNILPDDSAGTPLHLSPPGRFLRHVGSLFAQKLDAEVLLTLLKHPLTHSGEDRNTHQLNTQLFEMQVRRNGLPYPDAEGIERIINTTVGRFNEPESAEAFTHWAHWVAETFCGHQAKTEHSLHDWTQAHLALAERIAAGAPQDEKHELWRKKAGQKAREVFDNLVEQSVHGGEMSAADYADLVGALLAGEEVRDVEGPHPRVMIWGTLEARVQGADLVIMGGLNDGSWPEAPPADPWLNRQMRLQAGMLLPERRIGLSAHDYQQAIAAPEVWLTRSIRSDEAETVPSRWLNRLMNLLNGLPMKRGSAALDAMRQRGAYWLGQTTALEQFESVEPAHRPSPRPPLSARPKRLSVTEIKRLIRDPYAIYAKHSLRLRMINPLVQVPDALSRGIVVHRVFEVFIKSIRADHTLLTRDHLMEVTKAVLAEDVPWPAARLMWQARIERIADWFVQKETIRQGFSTPVLFEKAAEGKHRFEDLDFDLIGYADRIDRTDDGDVLIYDYKTGTPPSEKEQKFFDKQLLLEAAMVEEGGFAEIGPANVANAIFIGLGATSKEVAAPLTEEPPHAVLAGLHELIATYLLPDQGFTSRRLSREDAVAGDYDQLARYGEWDGTAIAKPEDLS